jgi:signal transduction histidine kinase
MSTAAIAQQWRAVVAALRRKGSPPPRLSRPSWVFDAVLALALAGPTLGGLLALQFGTAQPTTPSVTVPVFPDGPYRQGLQHYAVQPWPMFAVWVVLALLIAFPLVVRRRFPLTVWWVVLGATLCFHLQPGMDPTFTLTACVVAAYSAVMHGPYRLLSNIGVVAGAGVLVGARHDANLPTTGHSVVILILLIPITLAVNAVHQMQRRIKAVEAARETAARLALEQERSRIAQELHDVVTHNVSVMIVQAGAARRIMSTAPDRAQEALLAVEGGGRAAMSELRHVMGLLSMNGEPPDRCGRDEEMTPPPGLSQIPALADRVRETGIPIDLIVTGNRVPLPPGMDLAVYRVVQEALTNTVKHAVGAQVKIEIHYAPATLRVEVSDTGGSPSASARTGNGRGLIGLRERLAIYGGRLETGRLALGGYRVCAVIPMETVTPADGL